MATRNGAIFLSAQLQSFVDQTRQPDELVVTDDRSTDSTADIVRWFAQTSPFPVRLEINDQCLGVAQNFNRALSLCTGDLVLPSDQDDVWLPEKIAVLEQEALRNPDSSCFINDALLADRELVPTGTTKRGQIRAAGLPDEAMVMGCCAAFRRSLLTCLLPIPTSQRAHDNWLVQTADLLHQTRRLDECLQLYRRHGDNASDFFVNRLEQPNFIQGLIERAQGLVRKATHSGGLADEQNFLATASQRMSERQEEFTKLVGREHATFALASTEARARHLARRCAIRALPRYRRFPEISALWRDGGYATSGKIPSVIKDMLISATREIASTP